MKAEFAVAEFGRAVGVEQLSLHPLGHVRLGLPEGDWLTLEEVAEALLVSLVVLSPHLAEVALLQALQLCEARMAASDRVFQVGVRGDGLDTCLILVTRLPSEGTSAAQIMRAVEDCVQWVGRWRSMGADSGSGAANWR
jgi:type III secretion system chaperone SycN